MIDYKFGIIGTTCAGKTTKTYEVVSELKRMGLNADGVFQQDRRLPFDKEYLEKELEAQYWVVLNQALQEVEMTVGRPPKIMVSDRSVLDFYAYLEYQYGRDRMLYEFVKQWADTYTALYYLPPLDYQDDGARPDDDFRMDVDETLQQIISDDDELAGKVLDPGRDKILDSILEHIEGLMSPAELQRIPTVLELDEVLLGGSYAKGEQEVGSDVDLYIKDEDRSGLDLMTERHLHNVFGVEFGVTRVDEETYEDYLMNRPGAVRLTPRGE